MPPEAFEFVEILLHLVTSAPGAGALHEAEDEFFHRECGFSFVERGPDFTPVQGQSSEAEYVAVPGNPVAVSGRIDVPDKLEKPHQREERVSSDAPGAKRAVKLKTGTLLEDTIRSGRHAELDVAVRGSDTYQRVEK